jgi:predicted nucleic acid-binding protein
LRLAFDTNLMAYAEGLEGAAADAPKRALALRLVAAAHAETIVLPRQALAELHAVLVRKGGFAPAEAARRVRRWAERAELIDTDAPVFDAALTLAADHALQIFDALILAAAVQARCDLLRSEDLQDGFAWRGVGVTNPFGPTPDPRLARLQT